MDFDGQLDINGINEIDKQRQDQLNEDAVSASLDG